MSKRVKKAQSMKKGPSKRGLSPMEIRTTSAQRSAIAIGHSMSLDSLIRWAVEVSENPIMLDTTVPSLLIDEEVEQRALAGAWTLIGDLTTAEA